MIVINENFLLFNAELTSTSLSIQNTKNYITFPTCKNFFFYIIIIFVVNLSEYKEITIEGWIIGKLMKFLQTNLYSK